MHQMRMAIDEARRHPPPLAVDAVGTAGDRNLVRLSDGDDPPAVDYHPAILDHAEPGPVGRHGRQSCIGEDSRHAPSLSDQAAVVFRSVRICWMSPFRGRSSR